MSESKQTARRPLGPDPTAVTTVVLLRHGVTAHTSGRRFSGGLGGDNPPLAAEGRAQVAAAADWLAGAGGIDALIASPVRRTRESADIVADRLGLTVVEEPGFAEMEFGDWDGLSFTDVAERDRPALDAWLGDMDARPPGGESFREVEARVLAGLERLLAEHDGGTVLVVSHVTPIKTLVCHAIGAPLETGFRTQLDPASLTVLSFFPDARGGRGGAMRLFNAVAGAAPLGVEPGGQS